MSQQEVLDKIRKLLALATSPNEHEAKLAARRASELMEKYQIEESEVLLKESEKGGIVEELYTVPGQKMKLHWITILGHGCAVLFDGTAIHQPGLWGTKFKFVGHKTDIEAMKMLFQHLYRSWFSIVEADLEEAKDNRELDSGFPWQPRDTMRFKAGHGAAFANAILYRCIDLANERKKNVQAASNTGTALIRVKDFALQEWKEKAGVRTVRLQQSSGTHEGRMAGRKAGENIPLGGALGGRKGELNA